MKRAKQHLPHTLLVPASKPRNPLATDPLLAKGGAHVRRDKRAARALQKADWQKQLRQTSSSNTRSGRDELE